MLKLAFLAWSVAVYGPVFSPCPAEEPAAKSGFEDTEKTMAKLSELVGGTWVNQDPKFVIEFRYEWAFGKKAIRGRGTIDKGGPHESPGEAILGRDPVTKTVYYVDCHGGDNVFKGTVNL